MVATTEQLLQEFAAGLERARARCGELQSAVGEARARLEELRADSERQLTELRQAIAQASGAAREALGLAQQETAGSADLARLMSERLVQVAGEVQTGVDQGVSAGAAFAATARDGAQVLSDGAGRVLEHARDIGESGRQAFAESSRAFDAGLAEAASGLDQSLEALANASTQAFEDSRQRIDDALARDAVEKSASTRTQLQDITTMLADTLHTQGGEHQQHSQAGVDEHRENWSGRFAELAASARDFSGGVSAVGENVMGIARALTEGADTVTDAMDATNVGLRTVVGIFDNMRSIMDDIIAFA